MEGNPESALDQFGHAASGPEVGGEAVLGRFLSEPLANLLILFGCEKPGPARRGLGGQAGIARSPVSGHPLGDGDGVDTQSNGHGGLRPSPEHHVNPSPPHGFQVGSRSFASHGQNVT
jgi:hypothetical protein